MIDLRELAEKDIEREVLFSCDPSKIEKGKLTRWSKNYLFVSFDGIHSQACSPCFCSFPDPDPPAAAGNCPPEKIPCA